VIEITQKTIVISVTVSLCLPLYPLTWTTFLHSTHWCIFCHPNFLQLESTLLEVEGFIENINVSLVSRTVPSTQTSKYLMDREIRRLWLNYLGCSVYSIFYTYYWKLFSFSMALFIFTSLCDYCYGFSAFYRFYSRQVTICILLDAQISAILEESLNWILSTFWLHSRKF
jgi:hypothetical protein